MNENKECIYMTHKSNKSSYINSFLEQQLINF